MRDDLEEINGAIRRFTDDAVAADRIMRLPRDELGGYSIAESLNDDRAADAQRLRDRIGGGF